MDRNLTNDMKIAPILGVAEGQRLAEVHSAAADEYRAALRHESGMSRGDRIQVRLALSDSLISLSDYEQALDVLEEILEFDWLGQKARGRTLARASRVLLFLGNLEQCREAANEAIDALRATSAHEEMCTALRARAYTHLRSAEPLAAREDFRDALAAARRAESAKEIASAMAGLGNTERQLGNYEASAEWHRRSLRFWRELGYREQQGATWLNCAIGQLYTGDWKECAASLDAAEEALTSVSSRTGSVLVAVCRIRLERRRGVWTTEKLLEAAETARRNADQSAYLRGVVLAVEAAGDVLLAAGEYLRAAELLEGAFEQAQAIARDGDLVYEIAWRLSVAYFAMGRTKDAAEAAEEAVRLTRRCQDRRELGNSLLALAAVKERQGQGDEALELCDEALHTFEAIRLPWELAEAHEASARTKGAGRAADAPDVVMHRRRAREIYERLGASHEVERLESQLHPAAPVQEGDVRIIATDPDMRGLIEMAKDMAWTDQTVLIEGETGTGKELFARLMHEAGPRRNDPFVAINCAALSQQILESELFGHVRGSFTGAERDHAGHLEAAGNGTVLLDEIDKASPDLQARLLRVLEDRMVTPVGSTQPKPIAARIICATNRSLAAQADAGEFLPDLFFRLAGMRLSVPPLRERVGDLEALTAHFLGDASTRHRRDSFEVPRDVHDALQIYHWPGNVRQLKNALEGAAFFARQDGVLKLEHLGPEIRQALAAERPFGLAQQIEALEKREIQRALDRAEGNKAQAARILGVTRKGLGDRLRRLGLDEG